ncbi:TonB C-terminal domain-containing protein [Methyloversatilis sp.]|uniref:TonB C-terminal domain-containing protein n=1 Tax=Methyloversatilis sp. TaxID=2569862 RepID=UPI0027353E43|nr:TonB C-terminal domain-containing protein [Methyloversatilis sp.]MDP2868739.1 TonB C-terminal domain-containing protein [Methyloversatilis sp.]MDP3455351.1 TonB C-terminal domain-containing protein [Methyloversatilis sp.]MDP3579182.1 TonB C-terminal domain-containing protein [Methyloversatilis sp.]
MAALAEDSLEGTSTGRRVRNILLALVGMGVVGYGGYWLKSQFSKPSTPTRQVTKISIIPDTPPPPPPPPREEKRPEPKEQKDVKVEQPKPVEAPPQQAEQLKMEGAAGDGPSAFASGDVTNEYKGGDVGSTIGGAPAKPNRMQYAFYTNALQRHIQDELARNRNVKQIDYRVVVKVWLGRDGSIQRAVLDDSTGDDKADSALSAALADMRAFREAPPADMPQPIRLRITNRLTG